VAGALTRPRNELRRLTSEILRCKERIGRDLYGIGVRLLAIQERELWRAGGHDSFESYLEKQVDISRRNAYRFMRVAEHFNAQIAARYGVTKLDAALKYLAATAADEQPGDLLAAEIQIRDGSGRFRVVPLHEASAAQIDEATRLLEQSRQSQRRGRISKTWRSRADRLEERLPPALPGAARGRRVRLKQAADGRLSISFLAIPVDDLATFLAALGDDLPKE
jgi:hypothetical protein